MLRIEQLTHVYPSGYARWIRSRSTCRAACSGCSGRTAPAKSTLMRCVASLQIPTSGTIRFGDIDVVANPARAAPHARLPAAGLRRLSARVRRPRCSTTWRCSRGSRGAASGGRRSRRCCNRSTCGTCGTGALAGFSGGMRQRFGIAQALIGNPTLIIVDEPTAGLDPEERNRFLNLLAAIGEQVVVILSTHIVDDVSDLCQRMAIIASGRIVRAGAPLDLVRELEGRVWHKTIDNARPRSGPQGARRHLHAAVRRPHDRPRARARRRRAPDSARRRPCSRTSISPRCPRFVERPEEQDVFRQIAALRIPLPACARRCSG